ncbi:MAG: hypothetical protein KKD28_01760 [Chloroflexi bacterium]|nr:hypothetical protein [Chloroflexota bacterium]
MKYVSAIVLAVLLLTIPGGAAVLALDTAHPIESDLQSPPLAPAEGSAPCCSGIIPTFVITAVAQDNYVKIMTDNFPPDTTFTVTMGAMGTKGVGGIVVATTYSGTGGRFEATYSIPAALYGSHQIAVRLQSISSLHYAYNWFYNNNANVPGVIPPVVIPGYSGYPTFAITDVVEGVSVTIAGNNFTPNDSFLVRMNWMGTQGVAGTVVETVTTDASGKLSNSTYAIPGFLSTSYKIAIRLESPTTNYYAYNWFYNNSTGVILPTPTPTWYSGYPTFAITAVQKNNTVSIAGHNFPPDSSFWVRMNWMGTQGIAGVVVETVTTDANGNLSNSTYAIPGFLDNSYKIAIRLESATSYYYAYNWFYNNNAP